jgi:hypothetical protein
MLLPRAPAEETRPTGTTCPRVQAKCTERSGSLKEPFFREMKGPFLRPVFSATTRCADIVRKLQRAKELKTKELKIYGMKNAFSLAIEKVSKHNDTYIKWVTFYSSFFL